MTAVDTTEPGGDQPDGISVRDVIVDHVTEHGVVRSLDRVSLDVEPGTSLAIMGPSGCGKSTLLGVLAGLALPTSGSVSFGGVMITDLDERNRVRFRRSRLGVVYQADNLLPHLTVEENVGLQLAISFRHADGPEVNPTAALLDRLGIGALAKRLPDQLSGGQRQRVAVARAIVHRPAVILADEPTGSLDESNGLAVLELLVDAQRSMNTTLVMVTHDPAIAARLDHTVRLPNPTGGAIHAESLRHR
ncbi:MAG: ATP-binding cassette domain-containing protein [Ilumatobacteraceae bacterium]